MTHPIYDLEADAEWPEEVKVEDWRKVKDDDDNEDDEDKPAAAYVTDILGFDPDEFKEE